MISVDLARALRTAGLTWQPTSGDRFIIDERVLGFNGTVEWALDSVMVDQALWLPHEHQLRSALGAAFDRLETVEPGRLKVVATVGGAAVEFVDEDASAAYGRALLHVLTR